MCSYIMAGTNHGAIVSEWKLSIVYLWDGLLASLAGRLVVERTFRCGDAAGSFWDGPLDNISFRLQDGSETLIGTMAVNQISLCHSSGRGHVALEFTYHGPLIVFCENEVMCVISHDTKWDIHKKDHQ